MRKQSQESMHTSRAFIDVISYTRDVGQRLSLHQNGGAYAWNVVLHRHACRIHVRVFRACARGWHIYIYQRAARGSVDRPTT